MNSECGPSLLRTLPPSVSIRGRGRVEGHRSVLKKSDFLKEVVFQLACSGGRREGRGPQLVFCLGGSPDLQLRLGTPVLRSRPPASLQMAPVPTWAGLMVHCSLPLQMGIPGTEGTALVSPSPPRAQPGAGMESVLQSLET